MNFVRLGKSGLKISEITFGSALTIGTESLDVTYAKKMIDAAWSSGIRSFDLSNNYGNGNAEKLVGEVLRRYPHDEYILSTKGSWPVGDGVYHSGLSRKHILWAFDQSLKRLNMKYVDLYYAHRYYDDVPMLEIVRTFNYLIERGLIRYWGTSEWPLDALIECHEVCEKYKLEKPIVEQFIYSYALTKAEKNGVKNFCDENGVGTLGFSPLCQGYLTGKYKNGIPVGSRIDKQDKIDYHKTSNFYHQNSTRIDHFLNVANKYNIDGAHLAIRWCLRKKIYPVLGASRPEQIKSNVKALEIFIPNEVWEELDALE